MKKSELKSIIREEIQKEIKVTKPSIFTAEQAEKILLRNGIDDEYFDSMGSKEIEYGSDEWMDVLSDITGKDAYNDAFTARDKKTVSVFMDVLRTMGISFY